MTTLFCFVVLGLLGGFSGFDLLSRVCYVGFADLGLLDKAC